MNPKHDETRKIIMPYRSKKVSKMAQRHPTQTNRGQNHGLGGSKRSGGTKIYPLA